MEEHQLNQKEEVQLIQDYTVKHTKVEVEFYMGMIEKENNLSMA